MTTTAQAPVYVLNGVNGQLEVYETRVRIRRRGAISKLTQGFFAGEKDIYFRQVGSILIKRAGLLSNGYIEFAPAGMVEKRRGIAKATHDENTVIFRRRDNDLVSEIREYVAARVG